MIRWFSLFSICLFISTSTYAGVLLQGFYWNTPSDWQSPLWDRLAKQSQEIANAGFTAVWIPPVLKGSTGGYSMGYDPFDDYDIGSKDQMGTIPTRWGTREQLTRAIGMMRANGLEVYVDQVFTHRNGDPGNKSFLYADAFGKTPGGRFQKGPMDFLYQSGEWGPTLNLNSNYVQTNLQQAGDWLFKALDVQGLRIDYAKAVPAPMLRNYINYGKMNGKLTIVEYWMNENEIKDYLNQVSAPVMAFDFPLWNLLKEMSNGGGTFDMRRLVGGGFVAKSPSQAVTFVENHDTERDFPTIRNKHLGYAFILTSEGYPTVFWRDYYDYGMKRDIDNLIWIHEALATGATTVRASDEDLLIYERMGSPGVIAGINDNPGTARSQWVPTHFGANVRLHDYSGHQPDIQTNGDGWANINVPANSYVAYSYLNQNLNRPRASYQVTQEFAGASDLDIAPASNKDFHPAGRIYAEAGTQLAWDINFDHQDWNKAAQFVMQIKGPDNKVITNNAYGVDASWAKGRVRAPNKGWYTLEVRTNNAPHDTTGFWWRQTYQAPKM